MQNASCFRRCRRRRCCCCVGWFELHLSASAWLDTARRPCPRPAYTSRPRGRCPPWAAARALAWAPGCTASQPRSGCSWRTSPALAGPSTTRCSRGSWTRFSRWTSAPQRHTTRCSGRSTTQRRWVGGRGRRCAQGVHGVRMARPARAGERGAMQRWNRLHPRNSRAVRRCSRRLLLRLCVRAEGVRGGAPSAPRAADALVPARGAAAAQRSGVRNGCCSI